MTYLASGVPRASPFVKPPGEEMKRMLAIGWGLAALALPAVIKTVGGSSAASGGAADASFKSFCKYVHSAPDDPIVHPGVPGASHMHDFAGNVTTSAKST